MAIYGATLFKSPHTAVNFGSKVLGKNSEVITAGDPLTIDSTNGLKVYTTNLPIIGVAAKTQTMASTNVTVAKVTPSYIPSDLEYEFLMGCNTALTSTSVGNYYGLTGTTGAVQVDTTAGVTTSTNRMVVCTAVDPNGTGDLTQGLFKFVKVFGTLTN